MKVVITSQGKDMDSKMDPRFGRARYFVVVDTETGQFSCVDNAQNLNAAQGAGVQAAQSVANLQAGAIVTGHCGPKAFSVLNAAGIAVYLGADGTVGEAVEKFKAGEYQKANNPDVESHW